MILVLILALAFAIFVGCISDSILFGVIVFFIAFGVFAKAWNEAGATINMANQHKRDREIINELRKMNENKKD